MVYGESPRWKLVVRGDHVVIVVLREAKHAARRLASRISRDQRRRGE